MLNRANIFVACTVIAFLWWGSYGFPTQGLICNPPDSAQNCESYNILFALTVSALNKLNFYGALIAAIATGIIAWLTCSLRDSTKKMWEETKVAADAALKSANVAEKALTNVERPYLLITMPDGAVSAPKAVLTPGLPVYAFVVENIGKQIGTIITGNASFTIQTDSAPPPLVTIEPPSSAFCHVRVIGEVTIRPGQENKIAFICQRCAALTAEESDGLENRSLYGFFKVSLLYADPIGNLRNSIYVFVYLPKDSPHRDFPLTQVTSKDVILTHATAEQQKEAQHKLVGTLLKFYWDKDKLDLSSSSRLLKKSLVLQVLL